MSKIKVYNKGIRPVVFKRNLTGVDAIHPGKFKSFDEKTANEIILKFNDACSENDYGKHLKEMAVKKADEKKEAAKTPEKKTDSKVKK